MLDLTAGVVDPRLGSATGAEADALRARLAAAVGGGDARCVRAGPAWLAVGGGSAWVEEDALACVVGGTIYNAPALGERLGLPAGAGAAQVMAEAWRAWGPDAFDRARGDFAIAVFDAGRGTGRWPATTWAGGRCWSTSARGG